MSDKNPYYSIPKALGEPREEVNILPPDPLMVEWLQFLQETREILSGQRTNYSRYSGRNRNGDI